MPDDRFTPAWGLPAVGVLPAAVPARDAAGAVFAGRAVSFAVPAPATVFTVRRAAEFTLFFAGAFDGFVIALTAPAVFFEAGLGGSLTVFASLLSAVFRMDFFAGVLAVLLFEGAVAFTAALLTLLAAVLLVAVLVTVAFMVSLHY